MNRESTWPARLLSANVGLTAGAAVMIVASFGLGLRGGTEHRVIDVIQFGLTWSYLLVTPVLAVAAMRAPGCTRQQRGVSTVLLVLWSVAFAGSFMLHR